MMTRPNEIPESRLPFAVLLSVSVLLCLSHPRLAWCQDEMAEFTSLLEAHCHDCHGARSPRGDLNLEGLSTDLTKEGRVSTWTRVHDRLAAREMPPKSAHQPSDAERSRMLDLLSRRLTNAHRARREVVLRRLNRIEYEHTVRDLFGIEVFVREMLPQDASSHGFDNIGEALSVSTEQMEAYLDAADTVLDVTFGPTKEHRRVATTINLRDVIRESDGVKTVRITDHGVVLFNSGYNPSVLRGFQNAGPGKYRVRIEARAVQTDRPVTMLVYGGVWGRRDKHIVGFYDIPPGKTTTLELVDRLWESNDTFEIYPFDTIHRQTDPDNYDGPGLFVGDVRIEGPLERWPPPSRSRLLGPEDPKATDIERARRVLERLLPRAFRRPTRPKELSPILALVGGALAAGRPFEKALRSGLKGVLCSPEFLYLEEPNSDRLNDHAFATRLSYFLWSSMPDSELFAAAAAGRLRETNVLRRQVERMLRDEKVKRFIEGFTGQWLKLRDIDSTLPDRKLYPDYDELLKRSMVEESHRFFEEILKKDLSLLDFVDSDFVFVNERLARHYGIDGVSGQALRRVTLPPDSVRGGVLTQASVLKVNANGTTTSPVTRGVWVLDSILGSAPPAPPSGVAAVEPDIRGATTIREQLDKHRDIESCARCHRDIDPPGFALESFDVIGGWRTYYRTLGAGRWLERDPRYPHRHVQYRRGPNVDSSGRTPDGRSFRDIREYKRLLLAQKDRVSRCLTEKLLTYALGRALGFSDRPAVRSIVAKLRQQRYGLRTLVHEIVRSEPFQSR